MEEEFGQQYHVGHVRKPLRELGLLGRDFLVVIDCFRMEKTKYFVPISAKIPGLALIFQGEPPPRSHTSEDRPRCCRPSQSEEHSIRHRRGTHSRHLHVALCGAPENLHRANVQASLALYKANKKAFESPAIRANSVTKSREGTPPVLMQIPLQSIAPGKYNCQINLIDDFGREFAFPRISMAILSAP